MNPSQYKVDVIGRDLRELVSEIAPDKINDPQLVVLLNGIDVSDRMAGIALRETDRVVVGLTPAGGGKSKSVGNIVVGIILVVASIYSGGTAWAAYSGAMMSMGAGLIMSGVSGLLIKPPSLNASQGSAAGITSTAFMGGQSNQSKPYGVIPKLYGRHRMFPNLAASPLIDNVGTTSEIAAIYDFGYGNVQLDLDEVRIGESLASTFVPEFKVWQNTTDIVPILATSSVHYDQLSFSPQPNVPAIFSTKEGSLAAVMDLGFNAGLFYVNQYGDQNATPIEVIIEWAPTGTNQWTKVTAGQIRGARCLPNKSSIGWPESHFSQVPLNTMTGEGVVIFDKFTQPAVASVQISFPAPGKYDIRVTRTTPIWNGDTLKVPGTINGEDTYIPYNNFQISLIKSRLSGAMFNLKKRHTMLEMRLVASEKLSGVVQNMSTVATSILPTYDAQGNMIGEVPTRNHAWCALDVLLGDANPRPVRHDQIDWPAWRHLADVCEQRRTWTMLQEDGTSVEVEDQRYYCDMVLDGKSTVGEVLDSILSSCRAMRTITSTGLYSVALDEEQSIPRQLITPDNSWDFSGQRTFTDVLHAVRVKFTASEHDWQQMEVIVYADGYGPVDGPGVKAAVNLQTLESIGITDAHHAWAYGRYMLAQAVLRSEIFTVSMDIEHLVLQRGHLVYVAHTTPNIGGTATRVKWVNGGAIHVAAPPEVAPTGFTVRLSTDGSIRQGRVTGVDADGGLILSDATGIRADDLIVLGDFTTAVKPYLVQGISPGDSMSATVQLAPYDENLYRADVHSMPVWNPGFGNEGGSGGSSLVVQNLAVTQELIYINRHPRNRLTVTWNMSGYGYSSADVYAVLPDRSRKILESLPSGAVSWVYEKSLAEIPDLAGGFTLQIVPYTISGAAGTPATTAVTFTRDTTAPHAVTGLSLTGTDLSWVPPSDIDIDHFEVFQGSNLEIATRIGGTEFNKYTFTVPSDSATYLVRAVDTSGNIGPIASSNPSGWGLNWGNTWGH